MAAAALIGFLLGGWFGGAVGLILSALASEGLKRVFPQVSLRDFFDDPAAFRAQAWAYLPAMAGLALAFDPSAHDGRGAFAPPAVEDSAIGEKPRAVRVSAVERIMILEAVLSAAQSAVSVSAWRTWMRELRSVEEAAMRWSRPDRSEAYLSTALSIHADGALPARLAMAILSRSMRAPGDLERVEAFLERSGCVRSKVREAVTALSVGGVSAWDALGLAPGSGRSELKKAYRAMCMALHPDRAARTPIEADSAGDAFLKVEAAYRLLDTIIP
jgi:DnaJ-domain-containing protein 1